MASGKKNTLLSSLAAYGDDSEQDSDPETEEAEGLGGLVSASYGEGDVGHMEDGDDKGSGDEDSGDSSRDSEGDESDLEGGDADDLKEISEGEKRDPNELVELLPKQAPTVCSAEVGAASYQGLFFKCQASMDLYQPAQFSEKVRNMSPDEIRIPPEPPGRCSSHLQEKIQKLYERKLHGDFDTNRHIQNKKEFRNPSIYEKLIQFCGIDELGTNYPKDMFDPHGWSEDSYYEALAKAQKIEMDKLEKAKKERTKIEFVTGTKKGTTTSAAAPTTNTASTTATDAQKRKSKWDSAVPVTLAQPALLTTTATLPGVVSVTTTASGTKTTVISAVGTILKKAKQ
ncbi:SAP30-binding protein isoform X1 [Paramormyrops kingsleyae]|uniref:SAP30-binding protein isoform X1 n=1 Tax=Paramormyrops kingsleyae TaxID=1676925 RepID=UPI000CD64CB4|nr:SAP30-binding protein isoform X1 [Paramormyrops kingsleyae]